MLEEKRPRVGGGIVSEATRKKLIDSLNLDMVLQSVRLALCVTDPEQPDNPIIYVNRAFLELTGYEEEEVLGRNCRFLQGPNTTQESVIAVRRMVAGKSMSTVDIVNYRKDGTEFVNSLQIGPVIDQDGETVLMFGSQIDVTSQRAEESEIQRLANAEVAHRMKNLVTVMSSIMRTTARYTDDMDEFAELSVGRLEALSLAHIATLTKDGDTPASTSELCDSIVRNYAPDPHQVSIRGASIVLSRHVLSPLSLALHELATNSAKYGALSCEYGKIDITWSANNSGKIVEMLWRESEGPSVEKSSRSSGSNLITRLLERVGGSIKFDWEPEGIKARIELPNG